MPRVMQRLTSPRGLALWFLLCALPTGLCSALLTPIGLFPDEFAHIVRADGLRYGQVTGIKPPPGFQLASPNAGVPLNSGIFGVISMSGYVELLPATAAERAARLQADAVPWGKASYWPTQMVEYFPVFYPPAALGLWAGEAAGLTPFQTLLLGRIFMLFAYLALGTAALALARFGGGLLFAVLTLPTTVNLASSYSQDGLMTASCVLAVALLTRRPGSGKSWVMALVMLCAVASTKTPYAPLLLFGLLPLAAARFWRRAGYVLLACVPPALWFVHILHSGFMPNLSAPYHPGPLWPGPRDIWLDNTLPHNNIRVLLAQPLEIIKLPLISVTFWWGITWPLIFAMVGCDHGMIYGWEYPCLVAAMGMAALGALGGHIAGAHWGDGALMAVALFVTFIAMELSLYLTFTEAGYLVVMGVQSRYFLPFLPFLVLVMAWAGGRFARLPAGRLRRIEPGWFSLPAMALAAVNVWALPAFIFHLYRMAGP
jgi:hypothetical protein